MVMNRLVHSATPVSNGHTFDDTVLADADVNGLIASNDANTVRGR